MKNIHGRLLVVQFSGPHLISSITNPPPPPIKSVSRTLNELHFFAPKKPPPPSSCPELFRPKVPQLRPQIRDTRREAAESRRLGPCPRWAESWSPPSGTSGAPDARAPGSGLGGRRKKKNRRRRENPWLGWGNQSFLLGWLAVPVVVWVGGPWWTLWYANPFWGLCFTLGTCCLAGRPFDGPFQVCVLFWEPCTFSFLRGTKRNTGLPVWGPILTHADAHVDMVLWMFFWVFKRGHKEVNCFERRTVCDFELTNLTRHEAPPSHVWNLRPRFWFGWRVGGWGGRGLMEGPGNQIKGACVNFQEGFAQVISAMTS